MGDECVVLLERVLAENNRPREAMEARDAENQRLLKKLCSKLDGEKAKTLIQSCRGQKTTGKEPGTSLLLNSVE